ncbi:MAG: hypothetical protein ABL866_08490 [Devosia sp.]
MRNVFSTVAKLAAIAGVAMTMSAVSTTASSANDAHAYAKEVFDCYVLLMKNDPSRVEKCGVGDAVFNTKSMVGSYGTGSLPYCHCGYAVGTPDDYECVYWWEKKPS